MAESAIKQFDARFYTSGMNYLCGIDEAGRGPLAGPVVAAAVILPRDTTLSGINDSKKLTAAQRESLEPMIRNQAVSFAIGLATVEEIDRLNILQATFLAMKRALEQITVVPDMILVDGRDFPSFFVPGSKKPIKGRAIVGGDGKSLTIASASILAKTYRDRLMVEYGRQYPRYGFERHKGYGTRHHRQMILKYGPTDIHRKAFLRNRDRWQKNLFFTKDTTA